MRIDRIKLKTALIKQDLRQSQLADATGLSKGTIAGVANGKSCSLKTAEKIAEALNIPLEKLEEVK